jgi:hypothetical protein
MKRFHVHVHVEDLNKNIAFYSALFNQQPTRQEGDYAKWMLQDPPVNFAISNRGGTLGVDHLGIQVESTEALESLKANATRADLTLLDEGKTTCCYARSDKYWLTDPQGVAWEQFHTLENIPMFNESKENVTATPACCAQPATKSVAKTSACC